MKLGCVIVAGVFLGACNAPAGYMAPPPSPSKAAPESAAPGSAWTAAGEKDDAEISSRDRDPLAETPRVPRTSDPLPAQALVDAPALPEHRFVWTSYGFRVDSPVHRLNFHFRTQHLSATRQGEGWAWHVALGSTGRQGALLPVRAAEPILAACRGEDCVPRVEYRRGSVVEWFENTVYGLAHGVDVLERPPGNGRLILATDVSGLTLRLADEGHTLVFERKDTHMFTRSSTVATDVGGRILPTTLAMTPEGFRVLVEDTDAIYPVRVRSTTGACPTSWCSDGDESTYDLCAPSHKGGIDCTHTFDPGFEGVTCDTGDFCCDDGLYHLDCNAPHAAAPCPDLWCDDADPSTKDQCTQLSADNTFSCQHAPADDTPAPACEDAWCDDADPVTVDHCILEKGSRTCAYTLSATALGQECDFGQFCCQGTVALNCNHGPLVVGPLTCPSEWCDDMDPSTKHECHQTDDGVIGCAVVPMMCPNDWCSDGDMTTLDMCSDGADGVECTHALDKNQLGKACDWGEYCCNGIVVSSSCE